jgi:hypothetical protein
MAGFRQIHTKIWKDEWFIELDPGEKLLFIYLFSNDLASISGFYKIPIRVIMNETGLDRDFIIKALQLFSDTGKVFYENGCVWVVSMEKYHANSSETTQKKVSKDVDMIPDCELKRKFLSSKYHIDTLPIPPIYPDENFVKDKDKDKNKEKDKKEDIAPAGAQQKKPAQSYSIGQKIFLGHWNASRFKTQIQADTILKVETEFGLEKFKEYCTWAAKRGMSMGDAIGGIENGLKKWGKNGKVPPLPPILEGEELEEARREFQRLKAEAEAEAEKE